MTVKYLSFAIFFISSICLTSHAEESTSSSTVASSPSEFSFYSGTPSEAKVDMSAQEQASVNQSLEYLGNLLHNKKFEDTHKLTDIRLRAESGSLSLYSFRGSMIFLGPAVGNAGAPDRPNPDKKIGPMAQTLVGQIGGRYRLNSDASLTMSVGVSFRHPLQGTDRTDANNPSIGYDRGFRFGNLQLRTATGITYATVPEYQRVGETGGIDLKNQMVYGIGSSRFSLALDSVVQYYAYNRGYVGAPPVSKSAQLGGGIPGLPKNGSGGGYGDGKAQQYALGISPGIKYNFSDKMNVSGNIGFSLYNPRMANDPSVLWNGLPTVSLSMGYAYSRDLYLAPFIQSYPTMLSMDMTTINFATVFSLM